MFPSSHCSPNSGSTTPLPQKFEELWEIRSCARSQFGILAVTGFIPFVSYHLTWLPPPAPNPSIGWLKRSKMTWRLASEPGCGYGSATKPCNTNVSDWPEAMAESIAERKSSQITRIFPVIRCCASFSVDSPEMAEVQQRRLGIGLFLFNIWNVFLPSQTFLALTEKMNPSMIDS